ncbi:MAG: penicillin-binding protein 2 [Gammaproteobacteria bacterium TMED134]|nr:MAG: penicillin-binding protein 2 [Gammaproteobacteria bacterium TMED134]RZO70206.1 MAG: penicillin-binding protein 2 [OM182 bacterium]
MAVELAIKDQKQEKKLFVARAIVLFVLTLLLMGVLVARLIKLQVYDHATYKNRSDENRLQVQTLAPPRGMIFDRQGTILADNQNSPLLAVVPDRIEDMDASLALVLELLELPPNAREGFQRRLEARNRPGTPVVLLDSLTAEQVAVLAVNRHRLKGIEVINRLVRHYPLKSVAAHAVGSVRRPTVADLRELPTVQYSATEFIGKRGVEAFYEPELHGEVGYQKVEKDAHGRIREALEVKEPEAGKNIKLHLDARLQAASVAALAGRRGAIVALEPATGGVLSLVSEPSYDPNLFVSGMNTAEFRALSESIYTPLFNRAISGQYAPGSTFKPLVGLSGIALGNTTWEEEIEDRGEFRLPGQERVYRDWSWTRDDTGGQGIVDLRRAIYRSSNVYFYDLASRMEIEAFIEFVSQFGLGSNFALDLPQAAQGLLPNPDWKRENKDLPWYPGDSVNLGIGQGDLLATPIQMATVAAIIANRGRIVEPQMLMQVGNYPPAERSEPRYIEGLTGADWDLVVSAMEDVVHRGGQGYRNNGTAWAYIGQNLEYRMAGKSGTAQVVEIYQGEEYDEEQLSELNRKHAWFIAFAPVEDPKIAVAVLVENGGGGSSVAAPVAREVIDAYLNPQFLEQASR